MDLGIDGLGEGSIIGTGASAVVYRATQLDLGREVAVKILSATDPAFIRRFKREAKTLGRLSRSPGIVTVFDSGVTATGQPYLLLELCEASMLDRLQSDGPLDPVEACKVAAQVAGALAEAHEMGVVHRDMKPANILTIGDRYLVTDFGISTVSGTTTGQTNSIGFTAGYVAPETIAGTTVGPPADVYGLGATVFHLLTGETAFVDPTGEANLLALVHRVTNESVPDLRERGVPDEVCATVEWAMEKDPKERPTARRLQTRLERVVAGEAISRPAAAPALLRGNDGVESTDAVQGIDPVHSIDPPPATTGPVLAVSNPDTTAPPAPPTPPTPPVPAGAEDKTVNRSSDSARAVAGGALTTSILGDSSPSPDDAPVIERQEFYVEPEPNVTVRVVAAAVVAFLVGLGGVGAWLTLAGGEDSDSPSTDLVAGPSTTGPSGGDQGTPIDIAATPATLTELRSAFEPVDVIDVVGQDQEQAIEALEAAGFEVNVVRRESTRQRGTVLSQDPLADGKAPFASTITIFVAVPEPPPAVTTVINVAGDDVETAKGRLQANTLRVNDGGQQSEYSLTVPEGRVTRTVPPAGSTVNERTSIALVVSLGQPAVPSLVGSTRAEAEAALAAAGLPFETSVVDSLADAGEVIRTTPVSGAPIAAGGSVSLVVSGGPPCDLPDLVGGLVTQLAGALSAAGCPAATISRVSSELPAGTVITLDFAESAPGAGVVVVATVAEAAEACSFDLVGKTRAQAVGIIAGGDCVVGPITEQPSTEENSGRVISASVEGQTVSLVVGSPSCTVPSVAGQTIASARAALRDAGCTGPIGANPGDSPPSAIVESVSPAAGMTIDVSAPIALMIGDVSPPGCVIPDVVGMTPAAAEVAIGSGCPVAFRNVEVDADDPRIGTVIEQSVSGEVEAGTTVRLGVAVEEAPPPTVTVTVPPPTVTLPTVTVPTITVPTSEVLPG